MASTCLISSSSSSGMEAGTAFPFFPRPEPGVLAEAALPRGLVGVPGVADLAVRARLGVGLALGFAPSSLPSPASLSSSSSSDGSPLRLRSSLSNAAIFFLIALQALLTERGF